MKDNQKTKDTSIEIIQNFCAMTAHQQKQQL
jgi:hypothetical protein